MNKLYHISSSLSMGKIVSQLLSVIAVVLLVLSNIGQQTSNLPDAELRAELTLKGLFNYYWKKIEFLFVCGQLGEAGTSKQSQCSCSVPTAHQLLPLVDCNHDGVIGYLFSQNSPIILISPA